MKAKQSPLKSLPKSELNADIFKLDVYKVFLEHPSQLLYKKQPMASPIPSLVETPTRRKRGRPPNRSSFEFVRKLSASLFSEHDSLTAEEFEACKSLKVTPVQYLKVKSARDQRGYIKKREAQKICRIDVNKCGKIFDWFVSIGWMPSSPEDPQLSSSSFS